MKLVAFTHNNKKQIGAVEGEYVIPVEDNGPDNLIDFLQPATRSNNNLKIGYHQENIALHWQTSNLRRRYPNLPSFLVLH